MTTFDPGTLEELVEFCVGRNISFVVSNKEDGTLVITMENREFRNRTVRGYSAHPIIIHRISTLIVSATEEYRRLYDIPATPISD